MILESIAAAVILAGGNYADYATTRAGLSLGGSEVNALIGAHGERLAPIKIAATLGETAAFVAIRRKSKPLAWTFVAVVTGVNLAIAHHNAKAGR
jgi:hypothetical protein